MFFSDRTYVLFRYCESMESKRTYVRVEEERKEHMFFSSTHTNEKNICSFERMFFLTTVEEERPDEEGRSDEEEHMFVFKRAGGYP